MRILWFSNSVLAISNSNATGTWLQTMSEALLEKGVCLYNITQSCKTHSIKYVDNGNLKQWILPVYKLTNNGLPSIRNIRVIQKIVSGVAPDLIHVWGTEFYWGLLTARGFITGNIVLDIEGIMASCAEVYYGGLVPSELLKTIGLKELLKPSRSLVAQKLFFEKWGKYEKEMLASHKYISTQSNWVRNWIRPFIQRDTQLFETGLIIRSAFYKEPHWEPHDREEKKILAISSGATPYKCLHMTIKALGLLKQVFPDVCLNIAGDFGVNNPIYRKSGYVKYLQRLIKKLGLENHVRFLGPLTADKLRDEMLDSDAFVVASAVESYSLALAEAMAVGLPTVVSFVGAMPELAVDGESALFYPCLDYHSCKAKLEYLLSSHKVALKLSNNAISLAKRRNTIDTVIEKQLFIYDSILNGQVK